MSTAIASSTMAREEAGGARSNWPTPFARRPSSKRRCSGSGRASSGQELLHDLFGAPPCLRAAGKGVLSDRRDRDALPAALGVPRRDRVDEGRRGVDRRGARARRTRRRPRPAPKPSDNVLDGRRPRRLLGRPPRRRPSRSAATRRSPSRSKLDEAEFVTYGHIVVDEAQDLSPMELRVLKRRDLTGSMTIVGDMGQATTASSSASWDALLECSHRAARRRAST